MSLVSWMWGVWGALALLTCLVALYRARISRDEDDQLFLDDSFRHEEAEQAAISSKINKFRPIMTTVFCLAGAATTFVIGYYLWDMSQRL